MTLAPITSLLPARFRPPGRREKSRACSAVSTPTIDDAEIIRQFLATREDALFAQLIERYQHRVFRLAMSVLGPGRDADGEEVAQQAFIRVFEQLPRFRFESKFSTWLYRITWNCAIDEKNRITRRQQRSAADEDAAVQIISRAAGPEQQAAQAQQRARLNAALAELPESYQMTLRLHYWLGCSVEEVAELMGTTSGTVKSYLFRARARLQQLLTEGEAR